MSDFISSSLHKKIDALMDRFYGAGVASHPTIIEQINYLLFMRALSYKDDEYRQIGITDKNKIVFDGELEKYRWENLLSLNAEDLFTALEECYRKIPESTTDKTVRLVFRNAHIKLYDKPSLRVVLHEIDAFAKLMDEGEHKGKRDIFGDTYEYLLSKLAQAGTSGQFRTPRHIIEFLVSVVAPQKGETILDPAVGTAGFLVKAFEHMRAKYTSDEVAATGGAFNELSPKELSVLYEHTFSGFDSDEDMIKFGMMNLYLHGLQNARLVRQNTLTDTAGNRDKYDVILANPPFSGKLDRDSVAQELQMNTGATEVLFLRYMLEHLSDNGRAGVIVPEGVLFNASGAHTKIRQLLLENGLWCVVSLPAGVFNPYAGVKTSIVFFDKTRADKKEVLFAKVEHDGFSIGAQRRPIGKNDLPAILQAVEAYKKGGKIQPSIQVTPYKVITETKGYNLSGDRYRTIDADIVQKYQTIKLGDIFDVVNTKWSPGQEFSSYVGLEDVEGHTGKLLSVQSGSPKSTKTRFMTDDILVGRLRPNLNKVWLASIDNSICSTDFVVLRRKDHAKVVSSFFASIIKSSKVNNSIMNGVSGANLPRVPISYLLSIKVPFPPLEVQQKIVDEIEIKQKAINHAREIIKTLERERAHFDPGARARKEGWPIVKLGDIATLAKGKSSSTKTLPGNYPLVLTARERKTADHYDFEGNAVLIPLISATGHGKSDIRTIHYQSGRFAAANLLAVVIPDSEKCNANYLQICINAQKDAIAKSRMSGAANRSMKVNDLNDVMIPMPSLDIQKAIIDEFAEEENIIISNKKLVDIYEQKVHQTVTEIWEG